MRKKNLAAALLLLVVSLLAGCGNANQEDVAEKVTETATEIVTEVATEATAEATEDEAEQPQNTLPDGTYTADFTTDSSMFHVSEACEGKGTLTVANGEMTIHISLQSKKILNLYAGLAEDAEKEEASWLMPTEDTVTYSDGMTEEVYGFDVPVPALDTEFDLALIGTKGKWYDHKVCVSNPILVEDGAKDAAQSINVDDLENGTYSVEITFAGGSGKAEILSPVTVTVADGSVTAAVQWSSSNYDYMIVDGEKYLPISTEDGSVFEIPILTFDEPMDVIGDTVAMSEPHEIEYTITFHSDTLQKR